MAIPYINLPAARVPRNALLDMSPINEGIDAYQRAGQQRFQNSLLAEQRDMQKDQIAYDRGRDAKQDMRQTVADIGKAAAAGMRLTDPAQKAAVLKRIIAQHPDAANLGPEYQDPGKALEMIAAEAGQWRDPMEDQAKRLDMEYKRAQIGALNQKTDPNAEFGRRMDQAKVLNLQPGTPQWQAFVGTGRFLREDQQPLTATDKKAILEADEGVMSAENAISSLDRALELSGKAYDGATANERAWISSQFGSDAGIATRELNQAVTETALQQLRAIFGGNPTEGERKILLEIQGSAELPQAARDNILRRGKQMAQRRLEFNRQRANEMRGGTFYKPQAQTAPGNAARQPQGQAEPPQQFELPPGFTLQRIE